MRILGNPNESGLMKFEIESVTRLGKNLRHWAKKDGFRWKGLCLSPNTEPNLEGIVALVWP